MGMKVLSLLTDLALFDKLLHIKFQTFPAKQPLNSVIGCLLTRMSPNSTRMQCSNYLGLNGRIITHPNSPFTSDDSLL